MSLGNRTCQALLNALFGKTSNFGALASAPTIFVGLSSTDPAENGTNITEPSTGSYARVETAAADWNSASLADPSAIDNANPVTFPQATADWLSGGNIGFFFLMDAASGGNYIGKGALGTPKPVLNNDIAEFDAGDLVATLD